MRGVQHQYIVVGDVSLSLDRGETTERELKHYSENNSFLTS